MAPPLELVKSTWLCRVVLISDLQPPVGEQISVVLSHQVSANLLQETQELICACGLSCV